MKSIKVVILVGMVSLLVGCAAIKKFDKSNEYQKAMPYSRSMIIPSDLSGGSIKNYYPVPKVSNGSQPADILTLPPRSGSSK